jgi:hypothetical protein
VGAGWRADMAPRRAGGLAAAGRPAGIISDTLCGVPMCRSASGTSIGGSQRIVVREAVTRSVSTHVCMHVSVRVGGSCGACDLRDSLSLPLFP